MQEPYELHELAYQRIKKAGGSHWSDREGSREAAPVDPDMVHFLERTFGRSWAPRGGRVMEVGCGSAALLRRLLALGFAEGVGLDVSPTAIELAASQSAGLPLELLVQDFITASPRELGAFDLVVDGHCLHCITNPRARAGFLVRTRELLKPSGTFVLSTMCSPLIRKVMRRLQPTALLVGRTHYYPYAEAARYRDAIEHGGKMFIPQRYFVPWAEMLRDVRAAGFDVRLFEVRYPEGDDGFCGELNLAATRRA
jgi:SAM-dependent methyltransferase